MYILKFFLIKLPKILEVIKIKLASNNDPELVLQFYF